MITMARQSSERPNFAREQQKSMVTFILQRSQKYQRVDLERMDPDELKNIFSKFPPTQDMTAVTQVDYEHLRAQDGRLEPHRRRSASPHR